MVRPLSDGAQMMHRYKWSSTGTTLAPAFTDDGGGLLICHIRDGGAPRRFRETCHQGRPELRGATFRGLEGATFGDIFRSGAGHTRPNPARGSPPLGVAPPHSLPRRRGRAAFRVVWRAPANEVIRTSWTQQLPGRSELPETPPFPVFGEGNAEGRPPKGVSPERG
jgi:hypothetical protein